MGIGGAAVVAGLIVGVMSLNKGEGVENACAGRNPCPTDLEPDLDEAASLAVVADILLGSGLLTILAGFILTLALGDTEAAAEATAVCRPTGCIPGGVL